MKCEKCKSENLTRINDLILVPQEVGYISYKCEDCKHITRVYFPKNTPKEPQRGGRNARH